MDIFVVKHIQSDLYNLILLHNSRLQLFGKFHGQSSSILDFIALKHLKIAIFRGHLEFLHKLSKFRVGPPLYP